MSIEHLKPLTAEERKRFRAAPCFLCGYNSRDYYQPATHPCARRYHATDAAYIVALEDELSRLRTERDEALAEIERMTPEFVAYEYLESPAGREIAEARVVRLEKALEAIRDEPEVHTKLNQERLCCKFQDIAARVLSEREGQDG